MSFRATLDEHLSAICERDLPALVKTLAKHLTVITADGRLVKSLDEFVTMHRGWFESKTWTLTPQVVHLAEGTDQAFAIIHLDYRDHASGQKPIQETSYLLLVFQLQEGRWLMVHDQNTPIKHLSEKQI